MTRVWVCFACGLGLVALGACADDGSSDATSAVSASAETGSTTLTTAEAGSQTGDGDGDPSTGDGDGEPSTATGDGDGEPSTSGDGDGDPATGGPKFDLPGLPDAGSQGCGEGEEYEFSYLWVANSPANTVSKIDTRDVVEVARYATHPGSGNPSRTSVNLYGDVAVLNRNGSVIKIATREDDCIDANNDNMITTSTGANDVLGWGNDECVLWSTDMPIPTNGNPGPRALAWDSGDFEDGCPTNNAKLWVGYLDSGNNTAHVLRLDGLSGEILDDVPISNWSDQSNYSPYGGASDADGNFWILGKYPKSFTRIDGDSLAVDQYFNQQQGFYGLYGMTLDADGQPWAASWNAAQLWELDPDLGEWTLRWTSSHSTFRGMAIDRNGYVWAAANGPCGLVQYDLVNDQIVNDTINLPGCSTPVGVSIDVDDYVWVVDQGSRAYKVDPESYETEVVMGLTSPYTYSDMTGAGLGLVVSPQG